MSSALNVQVSDPDKSGQATTGAEQDQYSRLQTTKILKRKGRKILNEFKRRPENNLHIE